MQKGAAITERHTHKMERISERGISALKEIIHMLGEDTSAEVIFSRVLPIIGNESGKNRILLVPCSRLSTQLARGITLEWQYSRTETSSSPTTESESESERSYPYDWISRLEAGETVLIQHSTTPAQASLSRRLTSVFRSALLVPVFAGNKRWGHMRAEDHFSEYSWDRSVVEFLETAAALLGHHIETADLRMRSHAAVANDLQSRMVSSTISAELEEIRRLKDTVFSSFAHDFQTPLYTLLGFSATLIENEELDRDPEIRRMCLRHIHEQAHRLEALVKNILYVSDYRKSDIAATWERADLVSLLAGVSDLCRKRGEARGIEVILDFPSLQFVSKCQPERIARMLDEFFDWSLRNAAPGGWVSISVSACDGSLVITISDNGLPISEYLADRFYEPLAREASEGFGETGLSIAKDIVDLHGGFITVESGHDDGNTIRITLPSDSAK